MSASTSLAADEPQRRLNRHDYRTLSLAALGGACEFYDFVIYVFLASIIGRLFFPADMPGWLRLLQTFGIFAAGYLVGSLVFLQRAGRDLRRADAGRPHVIAAHESHGAGPLCRRPRDPRHAARARPDVGQSEQRTPSVEELRELALNVTSLRQ
jgi:hypothetical protein